MRIIFVIIWTIILSYPSFGQDKKENFDTFLFQFATEKEFQLERIKFPLEYVTWENEDEAGGKILTKKITKGEWQHV